MSDVKITNLVSQETIDKIKELDTEMHTLLDSYTNCARELTKGLQIEVKVIGDLDKIDKLYVEKGREATEIQGRLNNVMQEQSRVIANTTNTISRQLMEQERINKANREAYTGYENAKRIVQEYWGSIENQSKRVAELTALMKKNSDQQKANQKLYEKNGITLNELTNRNGALIASYQKLAIEKRALQSIMTAETKMALAENGSYNEKSQALELLKKAYKDLAEASQDGTFAKEMEAAIQDLDAHLKDAAADMGEFQRNVGNYAIAGQNGVVTTQSVVAALEQEAVTTQDLIDQTKILEEAKLRLNTSDANYEETLAAINAKLDENKAKLSDVSDILNKDATSVAEAEAQNKRLQEALKHVDLSSDGAQQRIKQLNDKIERNTKLIRENTPALRDNAKASEGLAGNMLNLVGINGKFGSSLKGLGEGGNMIQGLGIKVQAFGKTLMGLLANPWVLAFLGIAGVVAGFKWWYDFNKGLIEASRRTKVLTGATGDAADKITADFTAIADVLGKSFDETIGAANKLVHQFGLSWDEARELIEKGFAAGANESGKMIENIERFAPAMRDAGVSADEFMAILSNTKNGIFSEQGINNITKAGTRLRAMTKNIAADLDAVGISSKKMQQDLADGSITMMEAVQQVAEKLKELPENSQEAGKIMKDVFGRTAAEGGELLLQSIADINTNLDDCVENMGELGKLNKEQMEAQKELQETLQAAFKMSGTSFEEMTTRAKIYLTKGLIQVIKGVVDLYNWFVRLYNGSKFVRALANNMIGAFLTAWEVIKFILNQVYDSFKAVGALIEDVFTLKWDNIVDDWKAGIAKLQGNAVDMVKNIGNIYVEVVKEVHDGELKELSYDFTGDGDGPKGGGGGGGGTGDGGGGGGKKDKDAEKRAKEELKRLNELEEAKIAMMEEGHEKELAMIRLKFKKKIDEIRGNSATEIALRVQLLEQMENELQKCEDKYQKELLKINLDNALAAAGEGSELEYRYKLAKLEQQRLMEIEEAKKTGADVVLINKKYDKEKLDVQKEYNEKRAKAIQDAYANEQELLDNALLSEQNELQAFYRQDLEMAGNNAARKEQIEKQYQSESARLAEKYAIETSRNSVKMLEEVLKNEELTAEQREEYMRQLAKAKMELERDVADAAINEMKRVNDAEEDGLGRRIAAAEYWLQVAADTCNGVTELVTAVYDNQIAKIEKQMEALSSESEEEQNLIQELMDKKVITQEEGEARKRAAEEKTAKKEAELAKKKAEIQKKQAIWDKANALAQAAISTALGIVRLWVDPGFPAAIPLAVVLGALGALQMATIAATPLPQYREGTDYHKGGLAIVGDGGRQELVMFNHKAWLTPDTPTLVDMPRGASVMPDADKYLASNLVPYYDMMNPGKSDPVKAYNDEMMRREVVRISDMLGKQTRQQRADARRMRYEMFKSRI